MPSPLLSRAINATVAKRATARIAATTIASTAIARIDELLSAQVDAILHHPRFQALEAAWRGLDHLVEQAADGPTDAIKIRILDASWRDLVRDQEKALEFDQSQLFRKVYSAEYDTPGGEPYGLLIGDYHLRHQPSADVGTLQGIAQVAAAAFAPFVAGADPALLGLQSFADLDRPIDLSRAFAPADYIEWNALQQSADARFVGLCLPRILMRPPWRDDPERADGFRYAEDVAAPDRSGYLFGNAAFAFGAVVIRAVAQSGWPAAIRGVAEEGSGGALDDLVHEAYQADTIPRFFKPSTEMAISDVREKELSDLGLVPLCHAHGTELSAFYACPSLQRATTYQDVLATTNAKLSSSLQYMLCVARFAHHLKILARDRVGAFSTADEWERLLDHWLKGYTTGNPDVSPELLARHPLREGSAKVQEVAGRPGAYHCVIHLCPHFQLDQMAAAVRLETELFSAPRV